MSLPRPDDLAAPLRALVGALAAAMGESRVAAYCAELLSGADWRHRADRLVYLGGRPAAALVDGDARWAAWPRVWAARGLLYVWTEDAAPHVVEAVGDSSWRVAEMAAKVAARRELAEAAVPVLALLRHELPRVRATGVRTLGLVGDVEHVDAVLGLLDDPEAQVRESARRACDRLEVRLDIELDRR